MNEHHPPDEPVWREKKTARPRRLFLANCRATGWVPCEHRAEAIRVKGHGITYGYDTSKPERIWCCAEGRQTLKAM